MIESSPPAPRDTHTQKEDISDGFRIGLPLHFAVVIAWRQLACLLPQRACLAGVRVPVGGVGRWLLVVMSNLKEDFKNQT
jgi:hypothetical protein